MGTLTGKPAGIYWKKSRTGSWINLTMDAIENNINNVIENIAYIGISTGYKDEKERLSFSIKIPNEGSMVEGEYVSTKNYGTLYQWHFFLAYKDIINALMKKKGGYDFRETIWTTTTYNNGNEGENNGIQWGIDLAYEGSMVLWKSGKAYGIEVTVEDEVVDSTWKNSYPKTDALNRPGIYYTISIDEPNIDGQPFFPFKYDMEYNNSVDAINLAKYIVVNTGQEGEGKEPFYFKHTLISKIDKKKGESLGDEEMLTKYQWEFLFGYKDLLDKFYSEFNKNKEIGSLDVYGLPESFLTSTKYSGTPKSIAENENKTDNPDGVGIGWAVWPSLATSQIVIKKGVDFNYFNKVGLWK